MRFQQTRSQSEDRFAKRCFTVSSLYYSIRHVYLNLKVSSLKSQSSQSPITSVKRDNEDKRLAGPLEVRGNSGVCKGHGRKSHLERVQPSLVV